MKLFFSGRDYHSLQHENGAFDFDPSTSRDRLVWRPYPGVPGIIAVHDGAYTHEPDWYRNFVYEEERSRGLDFTEDLAAPGSFAGKSRSNEVAKLFGIAFGTQRADVSTT